MMDILVPNLLSSTEYITSLGHLSCLQAWKLDHVNDQLQAQALSLSTSEEKEKENKQTTHAGGVKRRTGPGAEQKQKWPVLPADRRQILTFLCSVPEAFRVGCTL